MTAYKLFYDKGTSAFVPHVMLEELGVDYRLERIDTSAKEHRVDAFRRINPAMLLPALQLPDGRTLGENGAILLELGERHPSKGLVPQVGEPDRPQFLQWLFALATTGHTTFRRRAYPAEYTTIADASDGTREAADRQVSGFLDVLESVVRGSPWLMERGFSALDIYFANLLCFYSPAERSTEMARYPKLHELNLALFRRKTVARLSTFYFG